MSAAAISSTAPAVLLTSEQVAHLLTVAPRTVEQWRQARRGPPYVLIGRSVRYRQADVNAWLDKRLVKPL